MGFFRVQALGSVTAHVRAEQGRAPWDGAGWVGPASMPVLGWHCCRHEHLYWAVILRRLFLSRHKSSQAAPVSLSIRSSVKHENLQGCDSMWLPLALEAGIG